VCDYEGECVIVKGVLCDYEGQCVTMKGSV